VSTANTLPSDRIPTAAAWLGAAGVVPFFALTLITLFAKHDPQRAFGARAFVLYSAIILSFLGGVRWGAALPVPRFRFLALAVAPSVIAFGCLLLPFEPAVVMLGLMFAVVGLMDVTRGAHTLWPLWYKRLRLRLSVAVVVLHILMYLGASRYADVLRLSS
jgi:hypothetical protein